MLPKDQMRAQTADPNTAMVPTYLTGFSHVADHGGGHTVTKVPLETEDLSRDAAAVKVCPLNSKATINSRKQNIKLQNNRHSCCLVSSRKCQWIVKKEKEKKKNGHYPFEDFPKVSFRKIRPESSVVLDLPW